MIHLVKVISRMKRSNHWWKMIRIFRLCSITLWEWLSNSESEIDNLQNVERVGKGYTVSPSLSSSMLMTPSFQISDGLRVGAIVALWIQKTRGKPENVEADTKQTFHHACSARRVLTKSGQLFRCLSQRPLEMSVRRYCACSFGFKFELASLIGVRLTPR